MKARVARDASQQAQTRLVREAELARSAELQRKARVRKASQIEKRNLEALDGVLDELRAELVQAALDGQQFVRAPQLFKKIGVVASKLHAAKNDLSDELPFLPPCLAPLREETSFGVVACERYLLVLQATLASLDRRIALLVEDTHGTLPESVQTLLFDLINASAYRETHPPTDLLRTIDLRMQPSALELTEYLDERDFLVRQIESLSKCKPQDVVIAWDLDLPNAVHQIEDYELTGHLLFSLADRTHDLDPTVSEDPLFHPRLLRRAAECRIHSLLKWILDHVEKTASIGGTELDFEMSEVILKGVGEPRKTNELVDTIKLLTLLGFEVTPRSDEVDAATGRLMGRSVRTSGFSNLHVAWG